MIRFLYYGAVLSILLYLVSIFLYILTHLISSIKGVPFIKLKKREWDLIFSHAHITSSSRFFELGSGTADISFYIAQKFKCKVTAIEFNYFLHIISFLKKHLLGSKTAQVTLVRADVLHTDISHATHIYLFMLPSFMAKIASDLKNKLKKGTIIISYGFKVPSLSACLYKTIATTKYPVYYYKL